MLIFNTTFHTDDEAHEAYLLFMKQVYIPQATKDGMLSDPRFARIHSPHQHGTSYSLQLRVKDNDTLNDWLLSSGELLNKKMAVQFGNKVAGFVTLMDEIDLS